MYFNILVVFDLVVCYCSGKYLHFVHTNISYYGHPVYIHIYSICYLFNILFIVSLILF